MARKIRVLQVGKENLEKKISYSDNITWEFLDVAGVEEWVVNNTPSKESKKLIKKRDILIFTDSFSEISDIDLLYPFIDPYRVFYFAKEQTLGDVDEFLVRRMAREITLSELEELIKNSSYMYYPKPSYGERRSVKGVSINPNFKGSIQYQGHNEIELFGNFGEEYSQLVSWRAQISQDQGIPMEIWPEFSTEGDCSIEIVVQQVLAGSILDIISEKVYSQEDLDKSIIINEDVSNYAMVSLRAKGHGKIKVGVLHSRESRLGVGEFLPGGKRIIDSNRGEVIYYFHPGDLKPPLNVYFSGYRTAEGFEGYFLMDKFKSPFILISDPRLEGGAFYSGSEELESKIENIINSHLSMLGFTNKDLILAGLSMGTFGALYYGAKLLPSSIFVGKPLANLGSIALNGLLVRPGEFDTSLDILRLITGDCTRESAYKLNSDFWEIFKKADFSNTRIVAAYMKHDDYDTTAYHDILDNLSESKAKIISKGIVGRHNDNTGAIVDWFVNQYEDVLKNDFGRS